MRIAMMSRWRGFAAAVPVVLLAGCANFAGRDNLAMTCGGNAYDNVMFNSDRYDTDDRVTVASLLGASPTGDISQATLDRVTSLAGARDAMRIADEYRICVNP